jgi:hypothetical protein
MDAFREGDASRRAPPDHWVFDSMELVVPVSVDAAEPACSVQDERLRLHLLATLCKGCRRKTGKDECRMSQLNRPAWLRPVNRTVIGANLRQSEVAFFAEPMRSA